MRHKGVGFFLLIGKSVAPLCCYEKTAYNFLILSPYTWRKLLLTRRHSLRGNCCSTLSITVNSCYESEVFFYEVLSFQALKAFATTKLLLWLEIYWRHLFLVEVVVFVLSLKSLKMVVDKKDGECIVIVSRKKENQGFKINVIFG